MRLGCGKYSSQKFCVAGVWFLIIVQLWQGGCRHLLGVCSVKVWEGEFLCFELSEFVGSSLLRSTSLFVVWTGSCGRRCLVWAILHVRAWLWCASRGARLSIGFGESVVSGRL